MKKAILVTSFGTSYEETRQKNLVAIEKEIEKRFKEHKIYAAYTSKIVKRILSERGIYIYNVSEAMQAMKNDGITEVVLLPTHLLCGIEYDKLCLQAEEFAGDFEKLSILKPLLSDTETAKEVLHIIYDNNFTEKDEAIVLMGHGTEHFANMVYPAMNYMAVTENLEGMFVGAVESYPDINELLPQIKKSYKKVLLTPLMVVAGDHAVNDMASSEEDSWKSIFEQNGTSVKALVKGLGEYTEIVDIYCKKIEEAVLSE